MFLRAGWNETGVGNQLFVTTRILKTHALPLVFFFNETAVNLNE